MAQKHILNCGNNYFVEGGSDRCMMFLEDLLREKGNSVISFSSSNERNECNKYSAYFPLSIDTKKPEISKAISYFYSLNAKNNMEKLLSDYDVSIAHLHIYYGKLTASILGPLKKRGIPIIQTLHEYKLICPNYSMVSHGKICEKCEGRHYWRAMLERCKDGSMLKTGLRVVESYISRMLGDEGKIDHFIAVSKFIRNKMIEYGIDKRKITTIHNFVDASKMAPNYSDEEYLLYFGRIENTKGIMTLVKAMRYLKDVQLVVAGDGNYREKIQEYLTRNGIFNVALVGHKSGESLTELIRNCRACVLPSEWYENCPMSLLEAYSYGKPVIGSNIGGIPELIDEGVTGTLFSSGDVDHLIEGISGIMGNRNRNRTIEMGRNARNLVEQKFNRDVHYQKLAKVYGKFGHKLQGI